MRITARPEPVRPDERIYHLEHSGQCSGQVLV